MKTRLFFIILILFSVVLVSCSDNISTRHNLESPYVVTNIKDYDKTYCLYILNTNVSYIGIKNRLQVFDSIGKFSIRDTIYVSLIKKNGKLPKIGH